MKNKMKRTFIVLFAFVFLFLGSCSAKEKTDENQKNNETETKEENSYIAQIDPLFEKDFHGEKFRIATDCSDLIFASNTQSILGKEYYLRNRAIEEKYNVKITLTEESGLPTITDRIKTEALAGTDYCDLVLLKSDQFQTLAASDLLVNVRTVPYLNTEENYFNSDSINAVTQGSFSYGVAGDFTFYPENCFAVFFNRDMAKQSGLPDLYKMVEQNQWDTENFLLYAEEIFTLSKINGFSVYGFSSEENKENLVNIFWAATGFDFLDNPYGDRPALVYDHNDTQRFISMMRNVLFSTTSYNTKQQNALENFANGETFLYIAPISDATKLVGKEASWGIVPIPKLDINQTRYYSYQDKSFAIAGFAKGTKDLTKSGIITTALFNASEGLNQKLKVQTYLNQYFSSPEDAKMMQKIIETPYYDPVEFFGQIDSSYTAATQTILYRAISSDGDFNKLYNQYSKMLNKYLDTKI